MPFMFCPDLVASFCIRACIKIKLLIANISAFKNERCRGGGGGLEKGDLCKQHYLCYLFLLLVLLLAIDRV